MPPVLEDYLSLLIEDFDMDEDKEGEITMPDNGI